MKKTFKELGEIDQMIAQLYKEIPQLSDTKFGYAYTRFADKNFSPTFKKFMAELQDARIDNALVDEKTQAILTDPENIIRGFKYSKEGLKAVMKAEEKIIDKYNELEIDIEPYTATFVPPLTEKQTEMLKGLLIADVDNTK